MGIASATSVFAAFAATAARWPQRSFLNVAPATAEAYGVEAGEVAYVEAFVAVERLQTRYAEAGYGAGDKVLVLLENRPAFLFHWFALNALGAVVVPVNPDLKALELEYLCENSEPVLAVSTAARAQDLAAAGAAVGVDLPVIGPDDAPPARTPASFAATPDRATPAAILYTSGSTGAPKGCVLTNDYFLSAGEWYAGAGGLCALHEDGERMLTPLPVFHMNAMAYSVMAMVAVGGCLTVLDRFHPTSWWSEVRAAKATCLHYLGVMPSILMKAEPSAEDRAHDVRFGFGAGVDPALHAAFEERFGFPLVEAWAMTETGAGAVIAANQHPRKVGVSCLGRPLPPIEARIVKDDGAEAGPDEPGELLVRQAGPDPRKGFFAEYYKNPEATAEAWEGGWFHTGDIVRRDADGDFFFVDRKKNVIRRSGENIAAVDVESGLIRHPEVKAVAVAAAPDAIRGDEVFACLVVEGARDRARAEAIQAWCLERMAYYKAPGYIAFVDALPLTSTNKLQRAQLKRLVAEMVGTDAAIDLRPLKKRGAS